MRVWPAAVALVVACGAPPSAPPSTVEGEIRARLGVPAEAQAVILFGQNAHLDVDWQRTFDDYYETFVAQDFVEARRILDAQPRAYYAVAEMAYLERHLAEHPEEAEALRGHAARGALRIVGGGMTSPDTLLPETELLLRDFLHGARFADGALGARATAAWLPDSFGHAATTPDVLAAAGFDAVAFARIDGAPTLFEDLLKHRPVRAGSDAAMLDQLGSADFVWRGPGGGRVLAHWIDMHGLYCGGDNIDYEETLETPGGHIGPWQGDQPDFTDGRIDEYVARLRPHAKTPYLFVPVGCDFAHPKEELLGYLDGYNQRRYPSTGVWAAAAPFDDYAALVGAHRDALPELALDLEPYFMGFYASRAAVKRRVREAARPFFAAESFALALGDEGRARAAALAPAWARLARSDHHDFVTGTSTDAVVAGEQLPLTDEAEAAARDVLGGVASAMAARIPASAGAVVRVLVLNPAATARDAVVEVPLAARRAPGPLHALAAGQPAPMEVIGSPAFGEKARILVEKLPPLGWRMVELVAGSAPAPAPAVTLTVADGDVVLANARVRAEWTRGAGGYALASVTVDGAELLAGPSFTVADYRDAGGLWRLGNEMEGCALTAKPPAATDDRVIVLDRSALRARVAFRSATATREAWLDAGDDALSLALTTAAAQGETRTATFRLAAADGAPLRTSLAGGFAERAVEKVYAPTFWPAVEWASRGGAAVLLRQSTGVRFGDGGALELMAVRDARNEQCDVEGGTGTDAAPHRIEWRLAAAGTPADAARAAQAWNRPPETPPLDGAAAAHPDLPAEGTLLSVEGDAIVSALKPAERGGGVILRALLLPGPATVHLAPSLVGRKLTRVDASERDLEDLGTSAATLTLDAARFGPIATVRIE